MDGQVFRIQLRPHGGVFGCAPQQTLLDAAIAAGYWLPHSCRAGTCDSCCLTIAEGAVRHAPPAPEASPVPEASPMPEGRCRTCQAYPLGDVVLEAPMVPREPGQRVTTAGARVLAVRRPTVDVSVIRLQLPRDSGFRFQAGQYADVLLKDGSRRSYSMANAPNDEGVIEWHVRRMEGGRFSTHAYDRLKERDLLRVQGPFGTFMLRPGDEPLVLLASGTGYAPIASMLRTHAAEIARRGAVLYWGGRRWGDLYAVETVAAWQAEHPGVRLAPVLSEAPADWQGRRGFVHEAVLQDLPDLSGHEVYACGNPLMIAAARTAFHAAGLPEGRFHSDAFITAAPAPVG